MDLFDERFQKQLETIAAYPPQALIFEGVSGHSARYEAEVFANRLLMRHGGTVRTMQKPEDKQVITIEQIQSLYRDTRTKQAKGYNVWIINGAELLSESAQNAFLKLLEEPPASVIFILSLTHTQSVLATILSRCQLVRCLPFSTAKAAAYMKKQGINDPGRMQQITFLAGGSTSELVKLLEDESYISVQLEAASEAKVLVGGSSFERIAAIARLGTKRDYALQVMSIALQMLVVMATTQTGNMSIATRLELFSDAYERMLKNGNIRLQLLRAALS